MPAWLDKIVLDAAACLQQPDSAPARQYLQHRGVLPEDVLSHQLGFTSPTFEVQECTEAFKTWGAWALSNRLVFPLTAPDGMITGIQTRSIDQKDYQLFYAYPRGLYPFMFGTAHAMPAIWATRTIICVEGVFDYFAVRRAGAQNVVAVMTAKVPNGCRKFFKRYATQVVALLDMDDPGREGAFGLGVQHLHREYSVVAPQYPAHDPGSLSTERLRKIVRPPPVGA